MKLHAFLSDHDIDLDRYEHAAAVTVADFERLVPKLPGSETKNLFLRDKKGLRFFLVMVPAAVTVDMEQLGVALDAKRLGFASADRLLQYLGVHSGSVSVLSLVHDQGRQVQFVIDRALWDAQAIQAHPLINTATVIIPHIELERFLIATGHIPVVIDVPVQNPDRYLFGDKAEA